MLFGAPGQQIPTRRVVITGIGAVSCCGIGADVLFDGLLEGRFSNDHLVPGFEAGDYFGVKEARRVDRFAQLALAAAVENIRSVADNEKGYRANISIGYLTYPLFPRF